MKIIVSNSSQYVDSQVRWLVEFAYEQVIPVARREGWLERLERVPISVRVTNCNRAAYCGRYLGVRYASYVSRPFVRPSTVDSLDKVRDILVRIGAQKHFPLNDRYAKFKDMPEEVLLDWCEGLVSVTAHEIAHTQYSGKRDGEYNCELVSQDAMLAFRSQRADFEAFIAKQKAAVQEREVAMAAKQTPQAVNAKKLATALASFEKWTRKLKLSTTKVKKYSRLVKRLNNRADELAKGAQS